MKRPSDRGRIFGLLFVGRLIAGLTRVITAAGVGCVSLLWSTTKGSLP